MIDRYGTDWLDIRNLLQHESLIRDEDLATMSEVSRHDDPQISPQEWECGCVTVTRITDRDCRRGEKPFEMRLAIECSREDCELLASRKDPP